MVLGTTLCMGQLPFCSHPALSQLKESELFLMKEEGQSWAPFKGDVVFHHTHRDSLIAVPGAPLLQDIQALWIMDVDTFFWEERWFLYKQIKSSVL